MHGNQNGEKFATHYGRGQVSSQGPPNNTSTRAGSKKKSNFNQTVVNIVKKEL